jgi:UMP-CMP kinase
MPNLFFVLGGPGCGKGTQCTLLNKKLKFLHISAGELLRKAAHLQEVSYYLNSGKIVPSQVTIKLL